MLPPPRLWDVFCHVIDNHGDLGVCARLARQLAERGEQVRLWIDRAEDLAWLAPDLAAQALPGVTWRPWAQASEPEVLATLPPADVWIEAFGCELPEAFVAHHARAPRWPAHWINLEYLSAEAAVTRLHGLPSPVQHGPAKGQCKHFFYPGFVPQTGGLLRERDLPDPWSSEARAQWQSAQGLGLSARRGVASLFCYEPPGLAAGLEALGEAGFDLLVAPGRTAQALAGVATPSGVAVHPMPWVSQAAYDARLWGSDLNFVRGEDSLVRALWAGQPFLWHLYPQSDHAHHAKLDAFLDWLEAPPCLREAHQLWNGCASGVWPALTPPRLALWRACVQAARARLQDQDDLVTQLQRWVGRV